MSSFPIRSRLAKRSGERIMRHPGHLRKWQYHICHICSQGFYKFTGILAHSLFANRWRLFRSLRLEYCLAIRQIFKFLQRFSMEFKSGLCMAWPLKIFDLVILETFLKHLGSMFRIIVLLCWNVQFLPSLRILMYCSFSWCHRPRQDYQGQWLQNILIRLYSHHHVWLLGRWCLAIQMQHLCWGPVLFHQTRVSTNSPKSSTFLGKLHFQVKITCQDNDPTVCDFTTLASQDLSATLRMLW